LEGRQFTAEAIMEEHKANMPAAKVLDIVQLLNQNRIEVILDGGRAVDALLGVQTRPHENLDLAVFHKDVPKIRAIFEARGYQEVPRDDSWECNFVYGDDQGHLIDFHSCTFDKEGNNIFGVAYPFESLNGSGDICGQSVWCIPPDWLVKFHSGNELDENDFQDVKLLCRKFDIPLPEEFEEFIRNDQT
jgi:lincosamide nucleotidyltransferase A/C/D/E